MLRKDFYFVTLMIVLASAKGWNMQSTAIRPILNKDLLHYVIVNGTHQHELAMDQELLIPNVLSKKK
jgi:hypothetical protein